MDLMINKGIIKKASEGELHPYILKDLKSGVEFPISLTAMNVHDMQEGDLVEFAGRVCGDMMYLAIAGVEQRLFAN